MVLRSGNLLRKEDQQVLCIAYHIRKLAVALTGKNGHELVVYNIDTGAPAFRKMVAAKVAHIQWKSNSALCIIMEDYTLGELCIATGKITNTKLTSTFLEDRKWEITAGSVWRKGNGRQEHGLAVAIAVKCDRDIVKASIQAGADLYGKNKKKKKNAHEEEQEESDEDEFDEKVAMLTWHLDAERKISKSAVFEDSHSLPVHSMIFLENLLLSGGEDGLVNVFDVNECDEEESIQTTIMADSSVAKICPLKNGLIGIVTDDNKQLLLKKNSAEDFDILHRRVAKRGHFLIDLVPGKDDEQPIAAVESDSRGELTITAFNEQGKNGTLLVRSYHHPDMISFIAAQGNIVCAVDGDANWSAYNITKGADENIVEEKPVNEEEDIEVKPRPFKRQFTKFRGGFKREHNFHESTDQDGNGVVSFGDDGDGDEYESKPNFHERKFSRNSNREELGERGGHRGFNKFGGQRGGRGFRGGHGDDDGFARRGRGGFRRGGDDQDGGYRQNRGYGQDDGNRGRGFGHGRDGDQEGGGYRQNRGYGQNERYGGRGGGGSRGRGFSRGRGGGGGRGRGFDRSSGQNGFSKPATLGGGRYKPY